MSRQNIATVARRAIAAPVVAGEIHAHVAEYVNRTVQDHGTSTVWLARAAFLAGQPFVRSEGKRAGQVDYAAFGRVAEPLTGVGYQEMRKRYLMGAALVDAGFDPFSTDVPTEDERRVCSGARAKTEGDKRAPRIADGSKVVEPARDDDNADVEPTDAPSVPVVPVVAVPPVPMQVPSGEGVPLPGQRERGWVGEVTDQVDAWSRALLRDAVRVTEQDAMTITAAVEALLEQLAEHVERAARNAA